MKFKASEVENKVSIDIIAAFLIRVNNPLINVVLNLTSTEVDIRRKMA